jgi:hypothetical protein
MQRRGIVGTVAVLLVLALAGRVATLAQKPDRPAPSISMQIPTDPKETRTKAWRSAGDPPPNAAYEPPGLPRANGADPLLDDPMRAVDTFLHRNQKEAADSIKALSQEAEALRARLQKVETALGRWKGLAEALDQQARSGVSASAPAPAVPNAGEPAILDPVPPPPPGIVESLPLQPRPSP